MDNIEALSNKSNPVKDNKENLFNSQNYLYQRYIRNKVAENFFIGAYIQ